MLMKIGILYFTTCFHGFAILRHVDPFVRMLHICSLDLYGVKISFASTVYGAPQVSFVAYYMGPPQVSFFA